MNDETSSNKKTSKVKKTIAWITGWLISAIVSGIIGSIFIPQACEKTKGIFASEPYVAVLISRKAIDFRIPNDFMEGFDNNYQRMMDKTGCFVSKNGDKVQIMHVEDFLSEEKTAIIAHRLESDNNCILVIGNANSTLTNINLDIFLNSKIKLPFIMPIATEDNLLKKAESANFNGVLRMLPKNGMQADTIERLVSKFAPNRKVAIYEDEENQSYSINLSRDIADKIRKKGGKIVIEELIGPSNSIYNSVIKWSSENKHPEVLVYVGVSHHGLLLLDQLSELDISVPIIFTDGCLVTSLLSNIYKYSGRSFILSPAEFKDEDLFLPSYKPIGEDAYMLASKIIQGSDGTRVGVISYIENHKKEFDFSGKAGKYGFNPLGENEARDYVVYEMKGGKLVRFNDF